MNSRCNDPKQQSSVLIVHRDLYKLDILARFFRTKYVVYTSYDAASAMNQYSAEKSIELIIIDNGLQPISGVELLNTLYDCAICTNKKCDFILIDENRMINQKAVQKLLSSRKNVHVLSQSFNPLSIYEFSRKLNPDMPMEKRHHRRVNLSDLSFFASDLNLIERIRVINISEKGALVDHPALLREGDSVLLRLWTHQETAFHLAGKIVRKAVSGGFGVSFIYDNDNQKCNILLLKNIITDGKSNNGNAAWNQ